MKIADIIDILQKEKIFKRTMKGRAITEKALMAVDATINDEKNYHVDAIKCKNCGIIISSLLVPAGCENCGSKDLTIDL